MNSTQIFAADLELHLVILDSTSAKIVSAQSFCRFTEVALTLTLVTRTCTGQVLSLNWAIAASQSLSLCFARMLITLNPRTIRRISTSHTVEGQSQKTMTFRPFLLQIWWTRSAM